MCGLVSGKRCWAPRSGECAKEHMSARICVRRRRQTRRVVGSLSSIARRHQRRSEKNKWSRKSRVSSVSAYAQGTLYTRALILYMLNGKIQCDKTKIREKMPWSRVCELVEAVTHYYNQIINYVHIYWNDAQTFIALSGVNIIFLSTDFLIRYTKLFMGNDCGVVGIPTKNYIQVYIYSYTFRLAKSTTNLVDLDINTKH